MGHGFPRQYGGNYFHLHYDPLQTHTTVALAHTLTYSLVEQSGAEIHKPKRQDSLQLPG